MNRRVDIEMLVAALAELGCPGPVLLAAMQTGGLAGAAALLDGLAAPGGPLGMRERFPLSLLLAYSAKGIAEWGFEPVYRGVIARMQANGRTQGEILGTIARYPISSARKAKLQAFIRATWDSQRTP